MATKEKQLYKAYNTITAGALKYFSPTDADYNLEIFIAYLQYLRDIKILNAEDAEHDPVINTLHNTITEYAKYMLARNRMASGETFTLAQIKALNTEKDTHYRQFWELLSHNFEGWFA